MLWNCSHYGAWHFYGHNHNNLQHPGLAYDVGVDGNNYTPISFEKLKKIMIEKQIKYCFNKTLK